MRRIVLITAATMLAISAAQAAPWHNSQGEHGDYSNHSAPSGGKSPSVAEATSSIGGRSSAGGMPAAPEGLPGDSFYEQNEYNATHGIVDTSVDSCAGGCFSPQDIDVDGQMGGTSQGSDR